MATTCTRSLSLRPDLPARPSRRTAPTRRSPEGVPIQYSGGPGALVELQSPAGAGELTYGVVKPVSQLGSEQLSDGQVAKNADGSLTIWFGPTRPAGAPASKLDSHAFDGLFQPDLSGI
jgi:hypothetical protein